MLLGVLRRLNNRQKMCCGVGGWNNCGLKRCARFLHDSDESSRFNQLANRFSSATLGFVYKSLLPARVMSNVYVLDRRWYRGKGSAEKRGERQAAKRPPDYHRLAPKEKPFLAFSRFWGNHLRWGRANSQKLESIGREIESKSVCLICKW